jgi:hypothetical protein
MNLQSCGYFLWCRGEKQELIGQFSLKVLIYNFWFWCFSRLWWGRLTWLYVHTICESRLYLMKCIMWTILSVVLCGRRSSSCYLLMSTWSSYLPLYVFKTLTTKLVHAYNNKWASSDTWQNNHLLKMWSWPMECWFFAMVFFSCPCHWLELSK